MSLADLHGLDTSAAALAALLHDRFKSDSPLRIESAMKSLGEEITDEDRPWPALWHGPRAAAHARHELGLGPEDALDAISEAVALHSTTDAGAGPLTRLMLLADSLEPTRDFEGIEELRKLAANDFEAAFEATLANKVEHMKSRGIEPSPRALRALAECQERNARR